MVTSSFRFSTGSLPLHARAKALHELRDRGVLPLESLPGCEVEVRIAKWFLPGAGVLSGSLCGVRQDAGPRTPDAGDDLFFGVNVTGVSTAIQRGRKIALGDGDAILLSYDAGPFTILRPGPVHFLGLRVPRKRLGPLIGRLDDASVRFIPGQTDALRLLTTYASAATTTEVLVSAEIAHLVASHLHDLIALSVGATRDAAVAAEGRGVRAARLQAIKSDIAVNLGDESLSVAGVAARHHVTPRYVHKLFEGEGITYSQFVLRQRLAGAYRRLRDPRFAARSISWIAYEAGFGDLSYFNRAFRRRYHATPSDVRGEREGSSTA